MFRRFMVNSVGIDISFFCSLRSLRAGGFFVFFCIVWGRVGGFGDGCLFLGVFCWLLVRLGVGCRLSV